MLWTCYTKMLKRFKNRGLRFSVFSGSVSSTSCPVLTWLTFPCGSCSTFWPRTCGWPRGWSTSTSTTQSAGSRSSSSSAGNRTSSSGRWGPGDTRDGAHHLSYDAGTTPQHTGIYHEDHSSKPATTWRGQTKLHKLAEWIADSTSSRQNSIYFDFSPR